MQLTLAHHTRTEMRGGRPRQRILLALAALAATLAAMVGVASAPSASASPIYGNWRIAGPFGGLLNDVQGGWFDGFASFDNSGSVNAYNWIKSPDGYTGPGGRKYHSYKDIDSGRCLSHTADILIAKPCDYWDYSQWWSVEQVVVSTTYPPNGGLPYSTWASLMTSWTAPDKLVTQDGLAALLKPRVGSTGSPAQRLQVQQLVIPH
jgi:hypothetical protein